ncbi:SUN family protein UTH1 [Aspergillus homomorphus CBS 101889]|uniref:SUN-domain-containing protein n=1 Tax=Aspergillus homomorphus (strain CBS 101889) TaxID=1450537 RepID=A0A395HYE2_ASPHC|nr:SUN-domain-containing protein [Aspergillus homomorphus CBS 101889]RAL12810.1 SUN-domain-containing protein [Aspergillus homomorphus CBS 101889]
MKLNTVAVSLATASLVAAQHHHQHRHHHKRNPESEVVTVTGPTVVTYVLDGKTITLDEVCKGIVDGTLTWASGQEVPDVCSSTSSSTSASTATSTTAAPALSSVAEFVEIAVAKTTSSSSSKSSSSAAHSSTAAASSSASSSSSSTATGLDADFPDGELDCDTFPSEYGAIALDYLGLGGWSGIQYVTVSGNSVTDIVTGVSGDSCTNGAMCSYACPAGYQKSQWPLTQGSTGQSVGGIQCKNGKLYLTNTSLSKKLCIEGAGGVHVQNTLGESVAVCRTDYPGTESETIPLHLGDNTLQPLTCPDGQNYYKWQGKVTSAQYYVNPKGVSTEKGCQWGNGSEAIGNWAPINLGVGVNNGKWLSIFQNSPTTTEKLDYNVKIVGDNLSGTCKYENGKFYSESGSNDSGCTVEVVSGSATYVFY